MLLASFSLLVEAGNGTESMVTIRNVSIENIAPEIILNQLYLFLITNGPKPVRFIRRL